MDPSELEGMTEDQIQQLVALGIIPEQMSSMDKQYKIANELRNTALPEGRSNGRVFTAANPMETVGALMQQYGGKRKMDAIEKKQDAALQQQAEGRQLLLNKYLGIQPGITDGISKGNYNIKPPVADLSILEQLRKPRI